MGTAGCTVVCLLTVAFQIWPQYSLGTEAADSSEGLSAVAQVGSAVTYSNDNAPVYTQFAYEAEVEENQEGVLVTKMVVTDGDEPHTPAWNAKFRIVGGDPGGFFRVTTGSNKQQEGIITTAKSLDFEANSKHTLLVAVENEVPFAVPLPTATATVLVNVKDVNEPPVFNPKTKTVTEREDLVPNSEVTQYTATDPDMARSPTVQYKIIRDPAGWLNISKDKGVIRVRSSMDRESVFVRDNSYTALIGAYDNDESPATGTGTIIIQLQDVNDNAPYIKERAITICNKEPVEQLLTVIDRDGPGFGAPFAVSLLGTSKPNWTAKMNSTKTGIILNLATELPSGDYVVLLRVSDKKGLEQESTLQAKVCDCTGDDVAGNLIICTGLGRPDLPVILGGILLLLLETCVNDPTAPPMTRFWYSSEGGGSDAGRLSSLNSSSSGDQDYNEWGPRFKNLADLYGGGGDDML